MAYFRDTAFGLFARRAIADRTEAFGVRSGTFLHTLVAVAALGLTLSVIRAGGAYRLTIDDARLRFL